MRSTSVVVIVPTRNREATIARALESMLSQTEPPTRVLVVDDGSTDETRRVVERVARSASVPITFVSNATCRGAAARRNEGVDMSDEEVVAFLDSDDAWHPHHLKVSLALLDHGADMTVSGFDIHGPYGVRRFRPHADSAARIRDPLDRILRRTLGAQTSSFVMRRDAFQAVRFDDDLAQHQDWDFVARGAHRIRIHDTADVTVAVHEAGGDRMSGRVDHRAFDRFFGRHGPTVSRRTRFALLVRATWTTLATEGRSRAFWSYWRRAAGVLAPDARLLGLWLFAPLPSAQAARRRVNRRRVKARSEPLP